MDSSALFHAFTCDDIILNFRIGHFDKFHLVDDGTLDITGMGDINLKTSFGITLIVNDVRYIPHHKRMLTILGHLDD